MDLEQQIKDKGLTAPRVTPAVIAEVIKASAYYVFPGTMVTVCCLTLENGFNVTGESACASPENFDENIGKQIAFENAKQKIWALEGYLLKQKLYMEALQAESMGDVNGDPM